MHDENTEEPKQKMWLLSLVMVMDNDEQKDFTAISLPISKNKVWFLPLKLDNNERKKNTGANNERKTSPPNNPLLK